MAAGFFHLHTRRKRKPRHRLDALAFWTSETADGSFGRFAYLPRSIRIFSWVPAGSRSASKPSLIAVSSVKDQLDSFFSGIDCDNEANYIAECVTDARNLAMEQQEEEWQHIVLAISTRRMQAMARRWLARRRRRKFLWKLDNRKHVEGVKQKQIVIQFLNRRYKGNVYVYIHNET